MAAEFTINGTAFDTLEYEAEHDEVLTFALEEAPGFDVSSVTYSVVLGSHGAPALAFSPSSGSPTTPTGEVTATAPSSGTHSYRVQCQVNNGYDGSGRWNSAYTRERIVSIRSANLGMRKLVPGETTQAHAAGWTVAQNEMVDAVDDISGGGGASGVVDPTPDTVAQRGPAGELKAVRFEAPIVRTTTNGDVTLQHGSTGFARIRSTGACSQPGDLRFDAPSGQLYVYVTGGGAGSGAGEIALLGYKVSFPKLTPDGSAAALFTETAVMGPPGFDWTLGSAAFIPSVSLEADAVNYASLVLSLRSASGAHIVVAAVGDTTPEGDNSTGSWSSFVPVPLTIQSDFMVAAAGGSDILIFDIGKSGAGVVVPSGVLVLSIVPWQEP